MARKDIDDLEVLRAYSDAQTIRLRITNPEIVWPEQLLQARHNEHEKVCFAAMDRAYSRGFLEYGVSLRCAWLTDNGERYLDDNRGWVKGGPRFVRDAAGALILVGSEVPPNVADKRQP